MPHKSSLYADDLLLYASDLYISVPAALHFYIFWLSLRGIIQTYLKVSLCHFTQFCVKSRLKIFENPLQANLSPL